MKYLTIIRHAKSSWDFPDLEDIERPLNERGKQSIQLVGNFLKAQHLHPDLMISSPAVRAQTTAKGIGKLIGYDLKLLRTEAVIYFGTSQAILELLQTLDDAKNDVFLFGHEPILSSLIFRLCNKRVEKFSTCGVCRIAFAISHWKDLQEGTCELFIFPKQLL